MEPSDGFLLFKGSAVKLDRLQNWYSVITMLQADMKNTIYYNLIFKELD